MRIKILMAGCMLAAMIPAYAQNRSPKRGICWDEKTQILSDSPIDKMLPGVTWIYTWGEAPRGEAANLGNEEGIAFAPMAWGRNFNESAIRNYVKENKTVKYLLGFNEPNFAAQSNMTPADAVGYWPTLEAIADEYGLKLVSPALNFTGEQVGGRVWGIYDWFDEFIRVYKERFGRLPKMDCLALHCYMNWYGANTWFVNEYIYSDIFKNGNDTKYPNLVELLNTTKEATGQFPRMMLTEFCSWEGDKDGFVTNVNNQIDQMTQRIQKMEQSDLVEGYAWFMANTNASQFPYMSVFLSNNAASELSKLGQVFVNMSGFDTEKYYAAGETVEAQDYIDATTDDQIVRVRPNSEEGSQFPLQVELTPANLEKNKFSAATYQVEVPAAGNYIFTLHAKGDAAKVSVKAGDAEKEVAIEGNPGEWADYTVEMALPAGKTSVALTNNTASSVLLNNWKFEVNGSPSSVAGIETASGVCTVYNMQGMLVGRGTSFREMNLDKGTYIVVSPDGKARKIVK